MANVVEDMPVGAKVFLSILFTFIAFLSMSLISSCHGRQCAEHEKRQWQIENGLGHYVCDSQTGQVRFVDTLPSKEKQK